MEQQTSPDRALARKVLKRANTQAAVFLNFCILSPLSLFAVQYESSTVCLRLIWLRVLYKMLSRLLKVKF